MITVAGLVLAASLANPTFVPPAQVDHRPCVSKREFNGAAYVERRTVLEAKWEVTGLGQLVDVPVMGPTVIYPRCGYSMDEAWYGVQYVRNQYGHRLSVMSVWWSEKDATPHGRP